MRWGLNINFMFMWRKYFSAIWIVPAWVTSLASQLSLPGVWACNGYTSLGGEREQRGSFRERGLPAPVSDSFYKPPMCQSLALAAEGWIIRQNRMNKWMIGVEIFFDNWGINLKPCNNSKTQFIGQNSLHCGSCWGVIGPNMFVLFQAVLCHKISRRSSLQLKDKCQERGSSNPIQGSEDISKYSALNSGG